MLYHMIMAFSADISLRELFEHAKETGGSYPALRSVSVKLEQTVPFKPDEAMLQNYCQAIMETYPKEKLHIENVKFDHYELLEEIDEPDKSDSKEETS